MLQLKMNAMNYLITADERLNRTNYEDWYPTVRSIMKAKEIWKYIEEDLITTMEEKVKNKTMTEGLFEKAKIEDLKAQVFFLKSITNEVK